MCEGWERVPAFFSIRPIIKVTDDDKVQLQPPLSLPLLLPLFLPLNLLPLATATLCVSKHLSLSQSRNTHFLSLRFLLLLDPNKTVPPSVIYSPQTDSLFSLVLLPFSLGLPLPPQEPLPPSLLSVPRSTLLSPTLPLSPRLSFNTSHQTLPSLALTHA